MPGIRMALISGKKENEMTKTELVEKLAQETGLTKVAAKKVVEAIFAQITKTLKKESRFPLHEIGVFTVVKRAKRQGRNPRTGEPVTIKAHKAVRFRPAKALKDAVR
jgi:DNA-binding protein HU-beta